MNTGKLDWRTGMAAQQRFLKIRIINPKCQTILGIRKQNPNMRYYAGA